MTLSDRAVSERIRAKMVAAGECWQWTGKVGSNGYGHYGAVGRLVHRVAYEVMVGPIPEGLTIDHLCMNKLCVNPAHLEAVTQRENVRRRDAFYGTGSARTHCPSGHPYNETNTARRNGRRHCRACNRERALRDYYRKKAQEAKA